jgi:hypothetical protein
MFQCVLLSSRVYCIGAECKSVITALRGFGRTFSKDPRHESNIRQWFHQCKETAY